MGLADCPKCWDAVCCCGYEYESWSKKRILGLIFVLFKSLFKYRRT